MRLFRNSIRLVLVTFLCVRSLSAAQVLNPSFEKFRHPYPRVPIRLEKIAGPFSEPTDLNFLPDHPEVLVILEKSGSLKLLDLKKDHVVTALNLDVRTESEQGLLGIAFHPEFQKNRRIYINYNPKLPGERKVTRISEFQLLTSKSKTQSPAELKAVSERVLMQIDQPFENHKAGQLKFGPDGFIYFGLGDGGAGGDPYGNSQNPKSYLGKMLRIDVDRKTSTREYGIPPGNPFAENPKFLPEIWALGLRNPWKFTFSPQGQLTVADVGQDLWEEISVIQKGGNYGWNIREAKHCYKPSSGCRTSGLTDPIFEYGHDEGQCIIGGYFYEGKQIPDLRDGYVFGDFVQGKLWALDIKKIQAFELGQFPIAVSTFGQRPDGEILLGDYRSGNIYQMMR